MNTPTLTGVLYRSSLGTADSAFSRRDERELAAATGSFAYPLKPGFFYMNNVNQDTVNTHKNKKIIMKWGIKYRVIVAY